LKIKDTKNFRTHVEVFKCKKDIELLSAIQKKYGSLIKIPRTVMHKEGIWSFRLMDDDKAID
jgi:hypothetical protein